MNDTEKTATMWSKLTAAAAYSAASTLIMLVNKQVLTQYSFPSFLFVVLLQAVMSVVVLLVQWTRMPVLGSCAYQPGTQYRFPLMSMRCVRQVMPLPIVFVLNTATGLGATKQLSMPLFVLLRRFSIVMTLLLEMYLLKKYFDNHVKASIVAMVFGAALTMSVDVSYEWSGIILILFNDLFTAAQGVGLRKIMDDIISHSAAVAMRQSNANAASNATITSTSTTTKKAPPTLGATHHQHPQMAAKNAGDSEDDDEGSPGAYLGSAGVMYYNNLLSIPFSLMLFMLHPDELFATAHFGGWSNPVFLVCLLASGGMGFVLNYAYYWCTRVNSPLTTTVIGALKNILTTYAGMLFRDFRFNLIGFIGINISVLGSLYYNKLEWDKMQRMEKERKLNAEEGGSSSEEDEAENKKVSTKADNLQKGVSPPPPSPTPPTKKL